MFSCVHYIVNESKNGGVVFGLSNRLGGVSNAPFDSLNLSFNVGDNENAVAKNIDLLLQNFAKETQKFECAKDSLLRTDNINFLTQMHDTKSILITQANGLCNAGEADVLITSQKGINLLILVADCNPVLFFDKKNSILALMHAGREGVFKHICTQTLTQMQKTFGTKAHDVFAFVGAGIRQCCYEVGEEIITRLHPQQRESYTIKTPHNTYKLDLALMLRDEFASLGITDSHISQNCTHCDKTFFSYRRDKKSGRFGLIAQLF